MKRQRNGRTLDRPCSVSDLGNKVSTKQGGAMHIEHAGRDGYTLCGVRWWFECNLGDMYCRRCQRILAGLYRTQNARLDAPARKDRREHAR